MSQRTFLCRSHPDCHLPPEVEVGRGFDGDAYARRMREAGADLAVAFAKCHYGYAYYPTRVGTPHPRLACDLFGETVHGLHRAGLGAAGYLSVHLDGVAAAAHPEWRMQGSTTTQAGFDSGRFPRLCVNSGYLEELFIPQCVEAVERFPIDELFLDTMPSFAPCYCPACRAAYGKEIPAGPSAAGWLAYARWYAGCFERFYARTTEAVLRVRTLPVIWNHKWTYEAPEMPTLAVERLATDRIASPGRASLDGRYFGGTGMPFEYMTGRFAHGLAEWNSNYQVSLDLTAAESVAHGGAFWLIDRQLPDGGLEERGWRAMRDTFAPLQRNRRWLTGTSQVHETAVLCSLDHMQGPDRRHFPQAEARTQRVRPIEAALSFLAEHGRLGHGMPRERLLQRLDDLRLVILPDVAHLDDELVDGLLAWVARGGRILASMPGDGPTGPICRLAGVEDGGLLDAQQAFIDLPDPLLIQRPWRRLRPLPGTATVAGLRRPLLERYGHGVAPAGPDAGCPAVVRREHGAGSIVLFATGVFDHWWMWPSPGLETLLLDWIDELLPDPVVAVDHPGQVEVACQRLGDDLVIHVINRCGRTRLGGWFHPMSRFVPPLADVPLRIRAARPLRLTLQPEDTPIPAIAVDGIASIRLPRLDTWQIVVSHGHFSR